MGCTRLRAGELACVVGDAADHGSGREEYAGLWTLVSEQLPHTAFAPPFAGLIADTHRPTGDSARGRWGRAPTLTRAGDRRATLHAGPTEDPPIESEATVTLRAPHYVDYRYRFELHEPLAGDPDRIELLWCNYINAVTDPAIYFVSDGEWVREYSPMHGYKALFYPTDLPAERRGGSGTREWWYRRGRANDATFDLPFYYGRVHGMVLAFLFDRYRDWRFVMSPTGGGGTPLGPGHHNPAWDWAWVIDDPEVGREYVCSVRLVYKPFEGRDDVLDEYEAWDRAVDVDGPVA